MHIRLPQFLVTATTLLELERNSKRNRAAFEVIQLRKFRRLVAYVMQHSPYYARIIREKRIDAVTCVPSDFPVLTKTDVMEQFDSIVTDRRLTKQGVAQFLSKSNNSNDLYFGEYQVVHTSGSSGEVGYFLFNSQEWGRALALGARLRAKPKAFKRQRVAFYGATGGHYAGVSVAATGQRGINRLLFDVLICEINRPLSQTIDELNRFQPEILVGYTTALKSLGEMQQAGKLRISLKAVEATGEAVSIADRTILESNFGCAIFNMYGCSEHMVMGIGAPGESDMVLYDDEMICELQEDHTVVTNLFNLTLPLIRYRMSDALRLVMTANTASPYRRIESVVGRVEIMPRFRNSQGTVDFISPHTINEIFVPGVRQFQMHLIDEYSFQFLIVVTKGLEFNRNAQVILNIRHRLSEILKQKKMENVWFDVQIVDKLPVDPKTRKFHLIVPAGASQAGHASGEKETSAFA